MTVEKIKICFIAQHPVEYHVGIYKAFFENRNFDSMVLYLSRIGSDAFYEPEFKTIIMPKNELLSQYKYKFIRNYGTNSINGIFSRINPGVIVELIKQRPKYIVIHGYSTITDIFLIVFSRLLDIKVLIKGESVEHLCCRGIKDKIKNLILSIILKNVEFALYSSIKNKKFWMKYGIKKEKCVEFICAIDNEKFNSDFEIRKKQDIRLRENTISNLENEKKIKILFVGRLTRRKNPIHLLQAVDHTLKEKVILIFVGSGEEEKELEKFAKERGVNIIMTGFINNNIGEYYAAADIFVNLSEYDPSPKTVNEAMNYGLPIIASSTIGTANEMIQNGENGYLYRLGNIRELREKLIILTENPDLLQKMGEKSIEFVKKFNYVNNLNNLISSINEI